MLTNGAMKGSDTFIVGTGQARLSLHLGTELCQLIQGGNNSVLVYFVILGDFVMSCVYFLSPIITHHTKTPGLYGEKLRMQLLLDPSTCPMVIAAALGCPIIPTI